MEEEDSSIDFTYEMEMTETETLLTQAQDIALRAFEDPTESAVMDIFRRLCCEQDEARMSRDMESRGVLH
ncbi:Uncharacterised protein [Achromobacter xylosoxidans]|nr:Uncharacterised protein [Achromobacter xylosoxidans]